MSKFRIIRIISIIAIFTAYKWSQPSNPPLNPPHRHIILNNFLTDEQHKEMMDMFEELGEFLPATQGNKYINMPTQNYIA